MIGSLRNDAKIRLIATLDSPLGGTPAIHTKVAQLLTPWGNPAAGQLKQLYSTALHDRQQGTNAALACSIFGGCPDFPVPVTNRQAVDASTLLDPEKQPTIVNIGADGDDAVYHPQICKVLLPPVIAAGDNSGSQWVDPIGAPTHIVIHPPMNGAKPQPLIPLISMQQFHLALIGVPGVLDPFIPVCIGNSHAEVLKRYGGFLAACVNDSSCP